MVDFNKLASLDIKNLDLADLSKLLALRRNTLIKFGIVAAALVVTIGLFNSEHAKNQSLLQQIAQAKDKLEAIRSREAAVDELNKFKSAFPKGLSEFDLINLISTDAESCRISVSSLSPQSNEDTDLYSVVMFNFAAAADTFKDMMLFLRKLETSPPLRIDSWSGGKDSNGKISFNLRISAVLIRP